MGPTPTETGTDGGGAGIGDGGQRQSLSVPRTSFGNVGFGIGGLGGRRKSSVIITGNDETVYGKNFAYYTREVLPNLGNYKNVIDQVGRPTLEELRSEAMYRHKDMNDPVPEDDPKATGAKFGWIEGVLVRCMLNIWGVMLFLRLSWVVAQAGIGLAIVIIMLSATVTTLTALSMSAISTNGEIKGGGIYYMVSRSLGPEFGGALGAIFSFCNATAVAMHTVGFAESLNDLLKTLQVKIVDNGQNDIRIVGTIALIVMQSIIIIGMEWESKAQIVLLIILLVAIADFLLGAFIGPLDDDEITRGYVGFNSTLFASNFLPDFRIADGKEHGFFSIFAIFFPAATGIAAGANISGDLKDPGAAIPKGTLLAIFITTLSYVVFALLSGAECLRDATGPILDDANATADLVHNWGFQTNCSATSGCKWGSQNSFQIMELMAIFGPIIYAGCFAATLSSALACLVSAPKIFQALCKDKLYPGIAIFGRGWRKGDDPFLAYACAFVIALAFILIAELNAIAPLISNFYMAAYTMVHICVLHATIVKPIGWRPQFKYFNIYTSGVGCALCIAIMFLMSWITALVTVGILMCLFFFLVYMKPDVNWGGSTQAQTYKSALTSVQALTLTPEHVKNYRPHILVLSGRPSSRPALLDLSYLITKNISMLICGHVLQDRQRHKVREYLQDRSTSWLVEHQVKGFYNLVDDVNLEEGARCLMQAGGVGKLRPNVVVLGFKGDWITAPIDDFMAYYRILIDVLDNHLGLVLARIREGFDVSKVVEEDSPHSKDATKMGLPRIDSYSSISSGNGGEVCTDITVGTAVVIDESKNKSKKKKELGADLRGIDGAPLPRSVVNSVTQFRRKQPKTTIDIWWMYDDGGLTMLVPHIISTRKVFAGSKIRVFALANKQKDLEVEEAALATLLSKFRIEYSDLVIISDVMAKAKEETKELFNEMLELYGKRCGSNVESEMRVDQTELKTLKEKTNRHLRLRELLLEHSRQANLIIMTLPIPRNHSAPIYMAWLDLLTRDMPPFLLVRGNQESVLTYAA